MSTRPPDAAESQAAETPVTVPAVVARKRADEPFVMVTAYDAPTARIADRGGADIVLVGDSLGMVVLGYDSTLQVTMDDMVRHTAAVTRTIRRPLVVGDMPYMSYHVSVEDTVRNAGRFIVEGGAAAVKLEGGTKRIRTIEAILDAEIPVMGHIGLTPQSINAFGGFRVQGRAIEPAVKLIEDAKALGAAGVFAIVLECVPTELAALITRSVDVPTIGIGAGPGCDGQVLVIHDLLGLSEGHAPKFVRRFGDLGPAGEDAMAAFAGAVRDGSFPAVEESYALPGDVAALLAERFPS